MEKLPIVLMMITKNTIASVFNFENKIIYLNLNSRIF